MVDTRSLNRSLLEAWRSVDARVARALEARGASDLSPRHAAALLLVERKGSRLTDLASRAGITKQAMMQVVDDLEVMGHLRRTADPSDARAKIHRASRSLANARWSRLRRLPILASPPKATRKRIENRRRLPHPCEPARVGFSSPQIGAV